MMTTVMMPTMNQNVPGTGEIAVTMNTLAGMTFVRHVNAFTLAQNLDFFMMGGVTMSTTSKVATGMEVIAATIYRLVGMTIVMTVSA